MLDLTQVPIPCRTIARKLLFCDTLAYSNLFPNLFLRTTFWRRACTAILLVCSDSWREMLIGTSRTRTGLESSLSECCLTRPYGSGLWGTAIVVFYLYRLKKIPCGVEVDQIILLWVHWFIVQWICKWHTGFGSGAIPHPRVYTSPLTPSKRAAILYNVHIPVIVIFAINWNCFIASIILLSSSSTMYPYCLR